MSIDSFAKWYLLHIGKGKRYIYCIEYESVSQSRVILFWIILLVSIIRTQPKDRIHVASKWFNAVKTGRD
jgi:hypothetical protein